MQSLEMHSKTGAAVLRRKSRRNPFEILVEIVESHPSAEKERVWRLWNERTNDEESIAAAKRYMFTNFYESLERDRRKPNKLSARSPERVEEQRQLAAKVHGAVAKILLMQMTMPNGKKLKDCTFAEIGQFGSWFKLLACKGKPSEIVGKVLTEADLHKIGKK